MAQRCHALILLRCDQTQRRPRQIETENVRRGRDDCVTVSSCCPDMPTGELIGHQRSAGADAGTIEFQARGGEHQLVKDSSVQAIRGGGEATDGAARWTPVLVSPAGDDLIGSVASFNERMLLRQHANLICARCGLQAIGEFGVCMK